MLKKFCLALAAIFLGNAAAFSGTTKILIEKLPELVASGTTEFQPNQGVAGAFSAYFGKKIFVAGGCNFPEKGPADGGKKVFFDAIWQLDLAAPELSWKKLSSRKLLVPAAYGASIRDCWIGGENSEKKLGNAISPVTGTPARFPDLPISLDNFAGAGTLVAGGNANGIPANKAFSLRKNFLGNATSNAQKFAWFELPDFPGTPRIQPVGGFVSTPRGAAFALVGGFYFDKATKTATLDRAGTLYFPREKRWIEIPPMPKTLSEAGFVGAAAMEFDGGLLIVGGVNAEIFKNALENPAPDYLRHEAAWYKFNADLIFLSFDEKGNAVWKKLGSAPELAKAGASLVPVAKNEFVYICGEAKPGLRSTECFRVKIEN